LLFYKAKGSFSIQVKLRLWGLEKDSFPLPYTRPPRPIKGVPEIMQNFQIILRVGKKTLYDEKSIFQIHML
jgi:hypothetical protein